MNIVVYKAFRRMCGAILSIINKAVTLIKFAGNGVECQNFRTGGIPYVMVARGAKGMSIGKNFAMNNGISHNPIVLT